MTPESLITRAAHTGYHAAVEGKGVFTPQPELRNIARLNGRNQLPKVIEGIKFRNGVEVTDTTDTTETSAA